MQEDGHEGFDFLEIEVEWAEELETLQFEVEVEVVVPDLTLRD